MLIEDRLNNCHRYTLTREWMGSGGIVNFLMLNPSTADDTFDDPTIRKCCGFAKRWGFSGIIVSNLFAFRATKPTELWALQTKDWLRALGERADEAIESAVQASEMTIAAWGAHPKAGPRAIAVMNLVIPNRELRCIGKTKDGFPLHPCMARYTDAPVMFRALQ